MVRERVRKGSVDIIGVYVSFKKNQIEEELLRLQAEVKALSEKGSKAPDESTSSLIRYLIEERERTNRAIAGITSKLVELEKVLTEKGEMHHEYIQPYEELPVSNLDATILDFVKGRGMACADDIKALKNYKGRNAACSRLKKLEKEGFLEKFQLGHKVYYRYYAGKTTKTLIVSPPQ